MIVLALLQLASAEQGTVASRIQIDGALASVYAPQSGSLGPVVVIAHGFAGSGRLMDSFALSFARAGYTAVSFDFPGHGGNPRPLTGSITEIDGATRRLLDSLDQVVAHARRLGDGRVALLGHSMASDVVVRYATEHPEVGATIAVSMFAPTVTASTPRNLLVIVGDWEGPLKREALRAVGLATAPATARPFVTYGVPSDGSARRVAFSPHVEHASVLFSAASMREAVAWLDTVYRTPRTGRPLKNDRGLSLLMLFAGVVLLAWPLSRRLPVIAVPALGAALPWRRLWWLLLLPSVATPLVLRVVPTHFLPVLVGDYLAVHFATYGILTMLGVAFARRRDPTSTRASVPATRIAAGAILVTGYALVALILPLDRFVTAFMPTPARIPLMMVMLLGTGCYFLADEWATRGVGAARGAYLTSKLAFLLSLGLAVGLDFDRLFFLIIIVPVIVLFFLVHGAFSRWTYRRTGHPFVAGSANAIVFAWAIGVTFPLLAG
jgi:pimeloyl-ACP methyl ester carboxylesterase